MSLSPWLRPPPSTSTLGTSSRHPLVRRTTMKISSLAALEAQIRHQDRPREPVTKCDRGSCAGLAELSGLCAHHQEMDRGC